MERYYAQTWRILAPGKKHSRKRLLVRFCTSNMCNDEALGLPEWGGGGALGEDLIVVYTDRFAIDLPPSQITYHEIAHIVLARAYPELAIPRWFHEGVAMITAGEIRFRQQLSLSLAVLTNSLLDLDSIGLVNTFSRNTAVLAYSQSQAAVGLLIDNYGIGVLSEILGEAEELGGFWKGMNEVLAIDSREFSRLLRNHIGKRYSIWYLMADTYALWIGIVVLFFVAYAVNFVRTSRKKRELEASETPAEPE